jgi:hypothetical protein
MAQVINGCKNRYTTETLYEHFGTNDYEMETCGSCENMCYRGGIISCKFITGEKQVEEEN